MVKVYVITGYDRIDDKEVVKAVFFNKPRAEGYRDKHNRHWDIEECRTKDAPIKI